MPFPKVGWAGSLLGTKRFCHQKHLRSSRLTPITWVFFHVEFSDPLNMSFHGGDRIQTSPHSSDRHAHISGDWGSRKCRYRVPSTQPRKVDQRLSDPRVLAEAVRAAANTRPPYLNSGSQPLRCHGGHQPEPQIWED